MGFCCESLALTCTMDNGDVPGATAFTTSPRRVPLPLTPGVLGGRVAEMMYWPLSLNGCETMEISCAPPFERKPPCCTSRSEEHTSELQSHSDLVCRLLLEKKKKTNNNSR